jgi:hypothetical protein
MQARGPTGALLIFGESVHIKSAPVGPGAYRSEGDFAGRVLPNLID